MINRNEIQTTDLTASLTFATRQQAFDFASAWSRKSFMGHTITKTTVDVYNVTDELKAWIDNYVSIMNAIETIQSAPVHVNLSDVAIGDTFRVTLPMPWEAPDIRLLLTKEKDGFSVVGEMFARVEG